MKNLGSDPRSVHPSDELGLRSQGPEGRPYCAPGKALGWPAFCWRALRVTGIGTRAAPSLYEKRATRWPRPLRLEWGRTNESSGNPFARSPAGAQGIAQFMPGTAAAMGLADPFDPDASIDAQARLMRDLLGRFGSVPLALAAYNAGPGAVAACGCIPPFPETRSYVARILGLL